VRTPGSRTQRLVAIGVVGALAAGGGVWLASGSSAASYRWTTASMADVTQTLDSYGTISPISQAALSFPVSGTVATVPVKVGDVVRSGGVLATLDTTSLQSTLDSARSTLTTAQNKLATDTAAQASGTTVAATTSSIRLGTTAILTAAHPTPAGGAGGSGGGDAAVTAAQQKLLADQQSLDALLTTLGTDVRSGDTTCSGLITTLKGLVPSQPAATSSPGAGGTSNGPAAVAPDTSVCTGLLDKVVADQQSVAAAQSTLATDETALTTAVTAALAQTGTGPTSTPSPTPTPTPAATPSGGPRGSSGGSQGSFGGSGFSSSGNGGGSESSGRSGGGGGTYVTAGQLVVDQATVDADAANVTVAEQALKQATLVSPLAGTVAAVAVKPGSTVSARTSAVTVIGPGNDQVTTTVSDLNLDKVKLGESATVVPDGSSTPVSGTVTAIGLLPVSSTTSSAGASAASGSSSSSSGSSTSSTATSSATYPVTVSLAVGGLYSGSGANVSIVVKRSSRVLTVPTSAVTSIGTRHVVTAIRNGKPATTAVEIGATDAQHTQITSGLKAGQRVALARLDASLPSSSGTLTNRGGFAGVGGAGGAGFGGSGAGFGGSGAGRAGRTGRG
jgi:trimeric autotransporter adhesin